MTAPLIANKITGDLELAPVRNVVMATRVDQYDAALIADHIKDKGISLSQFLREAAIRAALS